ncbi:MAG: PEP-utilizing enzyme [Nanoarchaeota archaeon]
MEFIRFFNDVSMADVALAGGKGASLGEMTRAGIPVPPGFVVLSASFDLFLKQTGLESEIQAHLGKVNHQDVETVERASEAIQALIMSRDMPSGIASVVTESFMALGAEFVAVRSSATAEDSSANAWAGQLDSFLNTTYDSLLENVKRCWASLFTPRAIFYRFEKGLHAHHISVAVVVQRMIQSEVAGVAFSVHPVTEDRDQILIEAGLGLGEAVVSGSITPDNYTVSKKEERLIDSNIGHQERMLVRAKKGNEWVPAKDGGKRKLTDARILDLARIVKRIERHYMFPVDIEWALEDDKFFIVQSRPITTLKDVEREGYKPDFQKLLSRKHCLLTDHILAGAWNDEMRFKGLTGFDDHVKDLEIIDGDYYYDMDWVSGIVKAYKGRDLSIFWEFIKRGYAHGESLRTYARNMVVASSQEGLISQYDESLELLKDLLVFLPITHPLAKIIEGKVETIVKSKGFQGSTLGEVMLQVSFPVKKNAPVLENEELLKIRQEYMSNKDFSLAAALKEHADKFGFLGYREPFSRGYGVDFFEAKVKGELSAPRRNHDADIRFTQDEQRYVDLLKEFVYFRTYRTERLYEALYYIEALWRRISKVFGLRGETDIGWYTCEEVAALLSCGSKVDDVVLRNRKRGHAVLLHHDELTCIFADEMLRYREEHYPQQGYDTDEIRGVSACKGKVVGRAKIVIIAAEQGKIEVGDILVTAMTTPDYLPCMNRAAAFVTDEGGITCHAAIVAREMRKPCIIGTKNATKVFKDGDMIEVDADNGVVRRIDVPKKAAIESELLVFRDRECALSPVYWNAQVQTSRSVREIYGATLSVQYNTFCDGRMRSVMVKDDWDKAAVHIAESLLDSKGCFDNILSLATDTKRRIEVFFAEQKGSDYSSCSLGELIRLAQDVKRLFVDYDVATVPAWLFAGDLVREMLVRRLSVSDEEIAVLSLPDGPTFVTLMEERVLQAACAEGDSVSLARSLSDEFYWIPFGYDGPTMWDADYFLARIGEKKVSGNAAKELSALRQNRAAVRKQKEDIIKGCGFSAEKLRWISVLDQLAVWTDERKMLDYRLFIVYDGIMRSLAKLVGVEHGEMKYILTEELSGLSKDPAALSRAACHRMSSAFMTVTTDGVTAFASDDDFFRVKGSIESKTAGEDVWGVVACRGPNAKYRAQVRIVLSPSGCQKVQVGDFLVATMTSPEFLPAMSRAVGFITDEGGITCHAAIVAREMGKPCIIGTKDATRRLKDGDLVEVDADKGIVRKVDDSTSKPPYGPPLVLLVERKYVPLMTDYFLTSYADIDLYRRMYGVDQYARCAYVDGAYYYGPEDLKLAEALLDREREIPGYIQGVFDRVYGWGDELLAFCEAQGKKDLSHTSKDDVLSLFDVFSRKYTDFCLSLRGFALQEPVEDELKAILASKGRHVSEMLLLCLPDKETLPSQEHDSLLRLSVLVKGKGSSLKALPVSLQARFRDHSHRFGWIGARGANAPEWSAQDVFRSAIGIVDPSKEILNLESARAASMKDRSDLERSLCLDDWQMAIVNIARELVYFRTYRTDWINMLFVRARPLLDAVARVRGILYDDLLNYRIDELRQGRVVSAQELARRREAYAMATLRPGELLFSTDSSEFAIWEKDWCVRPKSEEGVLSGTPAFKGKVQGRVKIVVAVSDVSKVSAGDILVAPMTTPDFIVAMRKASAFVTDEGGITCHAAIVAREMRKPCIIGTKDATRRLKDGDLVEVDADKGIVRKIIPGDDLLARIRSKGEWRRTAERRCCVFIGDLIRCGQVSRNIDEVMGGHVEPNGDILFEGHIFTTVAFSEDIHRVAVQLMVADGAEGLVGVARRLYRNASQLHAFLGTDLEADAGTLRSIKELYGHVASFLIPIICVERYLEENVADLLRSVTGRVDQEVYEALTTMDKETDTTRELLDLLSIAVVVSKEGLSIDDPKVTGMLESHAREFGWLGVRWLMEPSMTLAQFRSRLAVMLEGDPVVMMRSVRSPRLRSAKVTRDFVKAHALSDEQVARIRAVKELVYARSFRTEILAQANALLVPLLEKVAGRLGLSYDDVLYLRIDEMIGALEGAVEGLGGVVALRRSGFAPAIIDDVPFVIAGPDLERLRASGLLRLPVADSNEVVGACAMGGVAKGTARIVVEYTDLDKVGRGDILVVPMTFPHFIAAMEKAAAFVTDEGGITCHAAIVAREMGKPCVIGTKIATRVFKDGDLIEVDADKGVVRKIVDVGVGDAQPPVDSSIVKVAKSAIPGFIGSVTRFATRPMTAQRDEMARGIWSPWGARYVSIPVSATDRACYVETDDMARVHRDIVDTWFSSPQGWEEHLRGYESFKSTMRAIAQKASSVKDVCGVASVYGAYVRSITEYAYIILAPYAIEGILDPQCRLLLKGECGLDADIVLGVIATPDLLNEYQLMRLDIIESVLTGEPSPESLVRKFDWYSEYSFVEPLLDRGHFMDLIGKLSAADARSEKKSLLEGVRKAKRDYEDIRGRIKDSRLKLIADIIHQYTFIRTDRLDHWKRTQAKLRGAFDIVAQDLARTTGLPWTRGLVVSCLNGEILEYCGHGLPPVFEEVVKRKGNDYVYYCDPSPHIVTDVSAVKSIVDAVVLQESRKLGIRGTVAYSGKVSGRVVLVKGKGDLRHVREGDILVAKVTLPEYTPAMRRAAAVVTEEGGITSHAAVIARELKKPCIVGTSNCMRLLDAGDLVEVDANNGVVRKIDG